MEKSKKMSVSVSPEKLWYKDLVESAIDFIDHAIDDLEKNAKYSTINFAAGIELFLKARLMCEHWSLVIQSYGNKTTRQKILDGDVNTITPNEAKERISAVLGENIDEEWKAFDKLIKLRNKMLHFYHDQKDQSKMATEKVNIASLQCIAWYQLYHKLLRDKWSKVFAFAINDLAELDRKMLTCRAYLEEKYKQTTSHISELQNNGAIIECCPSCKFDACLLHSTDDYITEKECLVCRFWEYVFIIKCPKCNNPVCVYPHMNMVCEKCGHDISSEEFAQMLNNNSVRCVGYDRKMPELYDPIECWECDDMSVVQLDDDLWVCTTCHAWYQRHQIETCDRCGFRTTHDIKSSLMGVCEHCADSIMDDD